MARSYNSRSTGTFSRPASSVSTSYNRGSVAESDFQSDLSPAERIPSDDLSRFPDGTSNAFSVVTNLILSSSIYKDAVRILSSDREYGSSYLTMLRMIPFSHEVRDSNFYDDLADHLGGTSSYDKAVTDAFNAAMDEIRSLMQDYYSFYRNFLLNRLISYVMLV